jgi:tripartite-type tricarboxylate transporter receptor subunit TctC
MTISDLSSLLPQVKEGKVRILAVVTSSRSKAAPDIPTVAEQGFPGYEAESWFGLVAPKGTPKGTVSQISAWLTAALQDPDVRTKLINGGLFPSTVCGADFAAHLQHQYDGYKRVIQDTKTKAQ